MEVVGADITHMHIYMHAHMSSTSREVWLYKSRRGMDSAISGRSGKLVN